MALAAVSHEQSSSEKKDDPGGGFEKVIQKSWKSFSTMKRFVKEAQRLENASWRLWHMQRKRREQGLEVLEEDRVKEKVNEFRTRKQLCVYCELVAAECACDGCCHDAYCVPCFHLVHKKGHLATHEAQPLDLLRLDGSNSEGSQENVSTSPSEVESYGDEVDPPIKTWEVRMDLVIRGLMDFSLPSREDMSVRSIGEMRRKEGLPADLKDAQPPKLTFQSYMKTLNQCANPDRIEFPLDPQPSRRDANMAWSSC